MRELVAAYGKNGGIVDSTHNIIREFKKLSVACMPFFCFFLHGACVVQSFTLFLHGNCSIKNIMLTTYLVRGPNGMTYPGLMTLSTGDREAVVEPMFVALALAMGSCVMHMMQPYFVFMYIMLMITLLLQCFI